MYARLAGRTLLSEVQTNGRGPSGVCAAIVQADVCGTTERMLLLEYPLDNIWTYETLFEPLYKDHRRYARVTGRMLGLPDVRPFVRELVASFPYK